MPRFSLPLIVVLIGKLSIYALYQPSASSSSFEAVFKPSNYVSRMTLPIDLESRVLEQFDSLVQRKLVAFESSEVKIYEVRISICTSDRLPAGENASLEPTYHTCDRASVIPIIP